MGHLEVLRDMFPQKLFLDVSDIAKCLNLSKGHVYNLSSAKKLPFILDDHSDKVQVSIVAMARYLDSKLEAVVKEAQEPQEVTPVPDLIKPKKRGRPRNSQRLQLAFQADLKIAIVQEEVSWVFQDMQEKIDALVFDTSESVACSDKFNDAKKQALSFASYGEKYMRHAFLGLKLPPKTRLKTKPDF